MMCPKCGNYMYYTGNRYTELVTKIIDNKEFKIIKVNMTQKCLKCGFKSDVQAY